MKRGSSWSSLRYRLGSLDEHEVYDGELVGLILGLGLLKKDKNLRSISFWIDNQAAIRVLVTLNCGPSHYLLNAFHDELATFHQRNPSAHVTVHWIPGHTGVRGNEEADVEAKRAAHGNVSNKKDVVTKC